MRLRRSCVLAILASSGVAIFGAFAAEEWQEASFPPPNAGRLTYFIGADGNPACATYDGANCLWGKSKAEIDFAKVRPLACGARHRELYGSTGFEDPKHWCNLAIRLSGATPPAPAAAARLTDWSPWARAADVDYRYRVRWDPATGGTGKAVEAIFEIRNRGSKTWAGAARSLDCTHGTLWGSTDVRVDAQQTREARVRAPNCGTARAADIRPNVVRQGKLD